MDTRAWAAASVGVVALGLLGLGAVAVAAGRVREAEVRRAAREEAEREAVERRLARVEEDARAARRAVEEAGRAVDALARAVMRLESAMRARAAMRVGKADGVEGAEERERDDDGDGDDAVMVSPTAGAGAAASTAATLANASFVKLKSWTPADVQKWVRSALESDGSLDAAAVATSLAALEACSGADVRELVLSDDSHHGFSLADKLFFMGVDKHACLVLQAKLEELR